MFNIKQSNCILHDGLAGVKNDIKKVQTDLWETEDDLLDPDIVMEKLSGLEDRPQRNNFQIDGIPETCEKWESCEEELMKIIKSKLDITDDIKTDCWHHMGKFHRNKSKPQTVVCKFLHFKD